MTSLDIAPAARRSGARALASPAAAAALLAALIALACLPVVLWPIPRGADIVNHWARLTLYRLAPDDPVAGLYRLHFGLIPNLGLDALYLALSPLLSAQSVARLGWALAVALPAFGAFAIHRALYERPSPTIWLLPFLSYNVATSIGLLNYSIGVGLGFFGLAYALSRRHIGWREVLAFNLTGAVLFFCHIIAWALFAGLLGLTLVCVWPATARELLRRAGLAVAAQAIPLALVAFRETPPAGYSLFDVSQAGVLQAPVAAMTGSDGVAMALLGAGLLLALLRGVRVAPAARFALAGFALAALLAPGAHGAATLIDARLRVYVWYFAVAVTTLKAPESGRAAWALAAVALTAARVVWVAPVWEAFQDRADAVRAALAVLPEGARALVVAPQACADRDLPRIDALTVFAVIDRRAYVNTLYAQSGIQPVAPADSALDGGPTLPMDARWLTQKGQAELPAWHREAVWAAPFRDWRRHFTHILDAHGACASAVEAPGLTRLGGGGGLDVYRID